MVKLISNVGAIVPIGLSRKNPKVGPFGPIKLYIHYNETQFVFKFKLPVTKELIIHWDKNTFETVQGEGDTLITKTSSYESEGVYPFWLEGDVLNLTHFDISGQPFVYGDITNLYRCKNLELIGLQYNSNIIANVFNWGKLKKLKTVYSVRTPLFGDISSFKEAENLLSLLILDGELKFNDDSLWINNPSSVILRDNKMDAVSVDNMIKALRGLQDSVIQMQGNNDGRTEQSDPYITELVENNKVVKYNDILGVDLAEGWNTVEFWDSVSGIWSFDESGANGMFPKARLEKDGFWEVGQTYRIEIKAEVTLGTLKGPWDDSNDIVASRFVRLNSILSSHIYTKLDPDDTQVYYFTPGSGSNLKLTIRGYNLFSGKITSLSIYKI